ncbi:hypothetical protein AAG906_017146 [Vitis piasezkii]
MIARGRIKGCHVEPMVACHMCNESIGEALQLLLATRGGCLHDSFDLIWVDLYPLLSDHKPQKLVCAYPKGTFGRIELHVVLSQQAKDFFLKSGRNNQVKMRHCRGLPCVTIWQVTIGSTWHPSIPVRVNITKSEYLVQIRKACSMGRHLIFAGNLMHAAPYRLQAEVTGEPSVKKSSQHRCDTIPDPIKALLQLNIEVGNRDDLSSTTAYIVYLGGNAISQCSCKQKSITHSSTEAEYHALASTTVEVLWVHSLLGTLKATTNG